MKFIRVNMSAKSIKVKNVPQDYLGLGGRGLTSIMINRQVPPKCDPLGPENKLIFAPGLLSGTPLVNTSRLSVGAKSPLTGTIKESNVGAPSILAAISFITLMDHRWVPDAGSVTSGCLGGIQGRVGAIDRFLHADLGVELRNAE